MFLTSEKSLPENIPDHIRIKLDQLESYVRNFEHIYRMRRKDTIVEYLVNAIDFNENQVIWRLEIYVDYALLFYDEIWVKKDNYDMVNGFVNNIFIKLISYSLHSLVEEKSMRTKVGIKDENGSEK